jgi:hypothetical protein
LASLPDLQLRSTVYHLLPTLQRGKREGGRGGKGGGEEKEEGKEKKSDKNAHY